MFNAIKTPSNVVNPLSLWPPMPTGVTKTDTQPCRGGGGKEITYEDCTSNTTSIQRAIRFCHGCACPWRICTQCVLERATHPDMRIIDPVTGLCKKHGRALPVSFEGIVAEKLEPKGGRSIHRPTPLQSKRKWTPERLEKRKADIAARLERKGLAPHQAPEVPLTDELLTNEEELLRLALLLSSTAQEKDLQYLGCLAKGLTPTEAEYRCGLEPHNGSTRIYMAAKRLNLTYQSTGKDKAGKLRAILVEIYKRIPVS